MTKEDFLLKEKAIQEQMNLLREEYQDLKNEYLKAHSPWDINERVEIVTCRHPYWVDVRLRPFQRFDDRSDEPSGYIEESKRFAYVVGYTINYQGSVETILHKEKKDGTMSKHKDILSRFDTINKI
jgi:hypothetical protein